MSKRFGRKQKNRLRAEIKRLERENESYRIDLNKYYEDQIVSLTIFDNHRYKRVSDFADAEPHHTTMNFDFTPKSLVFRHIISNFDKEPHIIESIIDRIYHDSAKMMKSHINEDLKKYKEKLACYDRRELY